MKILTIKAHDFDAARQSVLKFLPEKERKDILAIIEEQEYLVKIRDRIIEAQREEAQGIFNIMPPEEDDSKKSAMDLVLESLVKENNEDKGNNDANPPEVDEHSSADVILQPEPKDLLKRGKRALDLGECYHNSLKDEDKKCPHCGNLSTKCREHKSTIVYAAPMLRTRTEYSEVRHCETCDTTQVAPMSDTMNQTIGRYHYSAVASLAALRYLYGMASNRMEEYSRNVGLKIADSTQWQLFEEAASMLRQFVAFLTAEAANAPVCHTDDTHQIIHQIAKEIEEAQMNAVAKGKNPNAVRSGIKTNNFTAVYPQGKIVLYRSGLHHAGEIIAQNLEKRTAKESLIVMMDALSANTSKLNDKTKEQVKVANCNAHVVRKFRELADGEMTIAKDLRIQDAKVSEEIDYFLRGYKRIFEFDSQAKTMSPEERLVFHQKNSLPIMEGMRERTQKLITNKKVEPNSDLGRVYQYFTKHWPELTAFCRELSAPIDNNEAERALKRAIRHRRNSLFFKNQIGAAVGDILTSVLMTAKENDLNPIEYLQNLLTHREAWKQSPSDWLPWNYRSTMAKTQTPPPE